MGVLVEYGGKLHRLRGISGDFADIEGISYWIPCSEVILDPTKSPLLAAALPAMETDDRLPSHIRTENRQEANAITDEELERLL